MCNKVSSSTFCHIFAQIAVSYYAISFVSGFQLTPNIGVSNVNKLCRSTSALRSVEKPWQDSEKERRRMEFVDLEPLPQNDMRRERIAQDVENQAKFAEFGDELWELRSELKELSHNLISAINGGTRSEEESVREKLRDAERRDPELTYEMEMLEAEIAKLDGRLEDSKEHREKALAARSCLPQFNLDGLWVGKYGNHGYEMINITYVGDTLIAFKVTGDKNVPRGEISFQADLSPLPKSKARAHANTLTSQRNKLDPIKLTEKAAKKWGTQQLPRYRGLGQVAEPGFKNSRWMDGQLIMIGKEYFSFAWVPIEQQIFFGRPSPELSLKMLREGGAGALRQKSWKSDSPPSLDADVDVLKAYATSILDKTDEIIEEERLGCIFHEESTEECYFE